jgi:hypothetical protein
VVSGGYGLFYDNAPAGLVDDLLANPPVAVDLRIRNGSNGVLAFDPGPNGAPAAFQASSAGFVSAFNSGGSYSSIRAAVPAFSAPGFTSIIGTVHSPRVQEWNLQIQQELGRSMVFLANYSGNHATKIPYANPSLNASDLYGFGAGIPATGNPSFTAVTQVQNGAHSFYDGVNLSLRRNFTHGISGGINYTWSHALDDVSNGGIFAYDTADSIVGQINPFCFLCNNYGNADYDIRHYVSAYYVFQPGFKFGNGFMNQVLGGWQWTGKVFWRTGLPFTVTDGNVAILNGPASIPAQPLGGGSSFGQTSSCNSANASDSGSAPTCLDANAFASSDPNFAGYTSFPTQRRNQYRGPGFFDMDMQLMKNFKFTEKLTFSVGANAYNVFNHPNFHNPDAVLGDSTFGDITSTVGIPASPYGSFVGAAAAPRILQLTGRIVF